jgi:DASS family divalent anion:Na+ symporter
LVKASAKAYGIEPGDGTARKIGAFLMQAAFQGNVVTSAMFLTAMAANPLAAKLAAGMHIDVSWGEWALAAAVPGLASLVLIPFILYKIYPPEIKATPGASQLAKEKLAEMGKMHRDEWVMLGENEHEDDWKKGQAKRKVSKPSRLTLLKSFSIP